MRDGRRVDRRFLALCVLRQEYWGVGVVCGTSSLGSICWERMLCAICIEIGGYEERDVAT